MRCVGIKSLVCKRRFAARTGFTVIEMVAIVIILAALAVTAVTKFDMSATQIDATAKILRSNLQLSQDMAMTQGTTFGFRILSTTSYEIYEGSPGTPATDPLTQGDLIVDISPVVFTTTDGVAFDSMGKPDSAVNVVIGLTDSGSRTRTITVYRNTGFIQVSILQAILSYENLIAMALP